MKSLRIILILSILLTLLVGCSAQADSSAWNLEGSEPIYVTEWQENNYTAMVPKPQYGEMDFVYDFSEDGRYGVFLKNITKEESEKYLATLKEDGFTEQFAEGNAVSVGTLLRKDGVVLIVAYSEGILGMLITLEAT